MYGISKIWSNLFWFGPAIGSSNFDEVQKISKFKNFYGKFVIIYQRRIPPEKFWILKFFGLRQNLTRQLQAQIKKGCSKFWICHTFNNFLNCGTNSTFKKQWADNVLKKISFHTRQVKQVKMTNFKYIIINYSRTFLYTIC